MFDEKDVISLAIGVLNHWYDPDDNGKDKCKFCWSTDSRYDKSLEYDVCVHEKDCIVLVAQDVISGYEDSAFKLGLDKYYKEF